MEEIVKTCEAKMNKAIESVKQYDINNIGQQWLKLINEK